MQQNQAWYTQSTAETLAALHSDLAQGLSESEVQTRRAQFGPNELSERSGKHPLKLLWEQVSSVMVLILIAAAVVSAFLGQVTEAVAIGAIVVLFVILGFVQEYRAEQAMAALKKLAVPLVRVRRGGKLVELSAVQLVPGDIILLEAGNAIPADARVVESANLRVQEAALTGESEAVEKQTAVITKLDPPSATVSICSTWARPSPMAGERPLSLPPVWKRSWAKSPRSSKA